MTDARGQLDLSASYTLSWIKSEPQITLNVTNITDEQQRMTYQYPNATYELYNPGRTIMLGIRGTF
jgi:outer membrane receptor protein involved in Fe transport